MVNLVPMKRDNAQLQEFEQRNNPTDAERLLWNRLRNRRLHGWRFLRQKLIGNHRRFRMPESLLLIIESTADSTTNGLATICEPENCKQGYRVLASGTDDVTRNIAAPRL